jgi:hypothetical protein
LRILLLVLVPLILIFACALLMIWLPLPRPFPPALSGARNKVAAIVTGVLSLSYVIGLTVVLVTAFTRGGRVLDPVFVAAGLAPSSHLLFGRQYHGTIEAHPVDVTVMPSYRVQPAIVEMRLGAVVGTAVAIGHSKPLLDCRGCPELRLDHLGLAHVQAYASDPGRAQDLLANAQVVAAVHELMADASGAGSRELYLQPERVWLRAHPQRLDPAHVEVWLGALLDLAQACEAASAD